MVGSYIKANDLGAPFEVENDIDARSGRVKHPGKLKLRLADVCGNALRLINPDVANFLFEIECGA